MSDIVQASGTAGDATILVPPVSQSAAIDPARQQRAKAYARMQRWLGVIDLGIGTLFLATMLVFGLMEWLRDAFVSKGFANWQPIAGWSPAIVAATAALLFLVYVMLSLPLAVVSGYVLPHRNGLSRQKLAGWVFDQIKTFVFGIILLVAAVEILYLLLATQPQTWWLWLAGGLLFFNVLIANLAPVLILPFFFKQTPLPDGDLRRRLLALATRAGTRVRGVFVMNMSSKTEQGNAALMGLGNTRRIVLGDTILRDYSPDEIEVVMAHEMGHHAHHDIWKNIITSTVLTLGGLALVNAGLVFALHQPLWHLHGLTDVAAMPLLAGVIGLYGVITSPISNTISRIMERNADQYALDMTRDPASFISAFKRLANQNLSQLDPNPLVEMLFYTHPAIGKRISHAERWQAQHQG
jgi:STE24 endopeptidase